MVYSIPQSNIYTFNLKPELTFSGVVPFEHRFMEQPYSIILQIPVDFFLQEIIPLFRWKWMYCNVGTAFPMTNNKNSRDQRKKRSHESWEFLKWSAIWLVKNRGEGRNWQFGASETTTFQLGVDNDLWHLRIFPSSTQIYHVLSSWFHWFICFNGKSTFVGYLMPTLYLYMCISLMNQHIARMITSFMPYPKVLIQKWI